MTAAEKTVDSTFLAVTEAVPTSENQRPPKKIPYGLILVCLLLYIAVIYSYMTARFAGNWVENDTALVARATTSAIAADSLLEAENQYTNGLGYPAVSVFLSNLTGIPNQTLQSYFMPLTMPLLALIFFVAYRTLLGGGVQVALIATFFIFIQPEFLWVTWRGSHEKMTWAMVALLLFSLTRTFYVQGKIRLSTRHMIVFYIAAFALTTSNVFFSWSFIFMMLISFVGAVAALRLRKTFFQRGNREENQVTTHVERLIYITLVCLLLLYVFIFFVYPIAISTLRSISSLSQQLSILFLNADTVQQTRSVGGGGGGSQFNIYNYVNTAWSSPYMFFILTIFNWSVLGISLLVWLVNIPRFLRQHTLGEKDLSMLFLWLVYPAFGLQLVLSVFADRISTLGGNSQVRLFTPLMLTAVPLAALGIQQFLRWLLRRFPRKLIYALVIVTVVWCNIAAVLKATNEPLFSNTWIFQVLPERATAIWAMNHLTDTTVWTGFDERIAVFMEYTYPELRKTDKNLRFKGFSPDANTRYYIVSELEQLRWTRRNLSYLYIKSEERIYDNGLVQLYHVRPQTPYQS